MLKKPFNDASRRVLDLVVMSGVAPSALLISSVASFSLLVNGKSPLPKRERLIGKDGRPFYLYRFESPSAPRYLTSIVELFKRVHVYDLPIFLNVIKGDMALVGPEALSLEDAEKTEEHNLIRFSVKPGLTDTYKIRKRMNIAFEGRSVLERAYVARRSVKRDVVILARTLPTLILGRQTPVKVNSFILQDIEVANLSMHEAIERLSELSDFKKRQIAFANPHCFNISNGDREYKKILKAADLVLPDGIGIKLAGMMIGAEVRENVNGTDLFPRLCKYAADHEQKLFLLGAAPGVTDKVAEEMQTRFPALDIAGVEHGFHKPGSDEEDEVIARINKVKPDYLLVAKGVPSQEKWIDENIDRLNVGLAMGVGGLFDFYSGNIPRAPIWVRELGLEWSWRLLQEPRRMFGRYVIGNPRFVSNVWRWYISQARTQLINRFSDMDLPERVYREELQFQFRRLLWWLATDGTLKLKRSVDVAASFSGLALLSPLLMGTAAAIKLEDPSGPVFYSQKRVGRHGELFEMYKFRSMVVDAEKLKEKLLDQNESAGGVLFKMKDDPRITRVGKFIRKYSIDELPQIYNVLKGDMSIVGPRPHLASEMEYYGVKERDRLEVTPGLTCLWQVGGRSMLDFNQQIMLDRTYIQNQSLWGDIKLILKTVPVVLSGSGAY